MGGGGIRGDRRAMEKRSKAATSAYQQERRRLERQIAASSYVPTGERFLTWQAAIESLKMGCPPREYSYRITPPWQATTVLRYDKSDGSKSFQVLTAHQHGIYVDFPDAPYRLYIEVRLQSNSTIFICEGEQATEAINDIGLLATTSLGGPGKASLTDWTPLHGKVVVVLPDFDEKGLAHADEVAQLCLIAGATSVKIVQLPGLNDGEGPVEWIGGRTRAEDRSVLCAELNVLVATTPIVERKEIPGLAGVLSPAIRRLCVSEITGTPLEWVWPGVIPRGKLTLLAGELGVGKSLLVADIIARQTRGDCFPSSATSSEPGAVLLFAAEDGIADTIVPRLNAAGADVSKIFLIDGLEDSRDEDDEHEPWSFRLDRDLSNLKRELKRLYDHGIVIRLIVIDPISCYQPRADSLDDHEMTQVVPRLNELAERTGAAILLVSHGHRSVSATREFELASNRSLLARARSSWMVMRDIDNSKRRLLLPIKVNLCEEQPGFAFSIQEGAVCWEEESVHLTAGEFLARPTHGVRTSVRDGNIAELPRAIEWLRNRLSAGKVLSHLVRREALANDISAMTLRRAFVHLGARAGREIGCSQWHWRLPRTQATEDKVVAEANT